MDILKTALAAGAVALFAQGANAAAILIDDFDAAQYVEDIPGAGETDSSTLATATVLGGSRKLTVETDPNNGAQPIGGSSLESTGVGGFPDPGVLKFNNDDGQEGLATVDYGLAGGGLALGDLTGGGTNDKFFFEILSGDLPGTIFSATVTDAFATTVTVSELLVPGFSPFLKFSDFAGVDFTVIESLTFKLDSNGIESFDGSLGSISAVPVPASGLLLLFGVGGVAAFARRRRKAA